LGPATTIMPFKKSKRQNEYSECIYIWSNFLQLRKKVPQKLLD